MVSARHDVRHPSERGLHPDASAERAAPRPVEHPSRAAQKPRTRTDPGPQRSHQLIPLRLHLVALFAFAAVVPVLVLLVLDAAGPGGGLPGPLIERDVPILLGLVVAVGSAC